jgi:hypothetical protein
MDELRRTAAFRVGARARMTGVHVLEPEEVVGEMRQQMPPSEAKTVLAYAEPWSQNVYIRLDYVCTANDALMLNTLVHEFLHVTFPESRESVIQHLTVAYLRDFPEYKHRDWERAYSKILARMDAWRKKHRTQ